VNNQSDAQVNATTAAYRVDPLRDHLLSLRRLGEWHRERTGEALHRSVPYKWAQVGVSGIRLPTVRIGGVRYTSKEAIAWWASEIDGGSSA